MKRSQVLGLFLWRTGLLLVGSYTTFRVARLAWQHLELPEQLDWGLAFVATGVLLVGGSIVAERVQDHRAEGSLTE